MKGQGLTFTGERAIPGSTPDWIWESHVHRYQFAAQYCSGRQVIDLGCGTGYGSAILAETGGASTVMGLDISSDAVDLARAESARPNVTFDVADLDDHPPLTQEFDVAVALEVIEHVKHPGAFLAWVRTFLKTDGILILSTPDRRINSPWRQPWHDPVNPFHVKEFSKREASRLLAHEGFAVDRVLGQGQFSLVEGLIFRNHAFSEIDNRANDKPRPISLGRVAHTLVFVCSVDSHVGPRTSRVRRIVGPALWKVWSWRRAFGRLRMRRSALLAIPSA